MTYRSAAASVEVDVDLLRRISNVLHVVGSAPPGCWTEIASLCEALGRLTREPPVPWCYEHREFHPPCL